MAVSQLRAADLPRPAASASQADTAYAELRRRIIQCRLEPGRQLRESALVQLVGVGKTPVREALGRLVQEGLVEVHPRQGYRVAPITLRVVQDLFDLRMLVEPAAAERAAGRVDADHLRRLDELCRAGYRLGDSESAADFLRANTELHVTVARASGNARLTNLLATLLEESERLFHVGLMLRNRTDEMAHEHKELVDALATGDRLAVRSIVGEQIAAARRMVIDALLSAPALLDAQMGPELFAYRDGS
jgi:DNA-binding GntR family transcriptional regulator